MSNEMEPTKDERRNGWTREALEVYVGQRKAAQDAALDPMSEARRLARKPQRAKRYRPLRWRG